MMLFYLCTGDNDAVLALLLIPRLMAKCELLMTQVRDKVGSFQSSMVAG